MLKMLKKLKSTKSVLFFALFKSNRIEATRMKVFFTEKTPLDLNNWCHSERVKLEEENGEPFITVNCKIIR